MNGRAVRNRRRSRARVAAADPAAARDPNALWRGPAAVRFGDGPPTSAARPARDGLDGAVDLGFGEGPIVRLEREPEGQALLARRRVAGRDRCRTARRHEAARPPCRRIAASTSADVVDSGTMTARSRSTAGCRDGVDAARSCSAARRTGRRSRARRRRRRSARSSRASSKRRMERPDPAGQRRSPAVTRAARPGMQVRIVGQAAHRPARAARGAARAARSRPWRRRGRTAAPAGSRPGSRPRRSARDRAATIRAVDRRRRWRRSPCRSRRSPRPAGPGGGSSRRPRGGCRCRLWRITECWLDSGFVTVTGRPARRRPRPATGGSSGGPNRSTMCGRDEGVRHGLGQTGAGQRLADACAGARSGECR